MGELLNGIFECLDINSSTGLATEDSLQSMTSFQRLFYTQVHEKIGIDAVYFLRDENGIAKIPLIYFSAIQKYDAKQVAELHRLSWNLGEAPLLFVVTPDEILIYNNYETPRVVENGNLDPNAGIIETLNLTNGLASQRLALKKYHRSLIESGEYWRQSMTRFDVQSRVDSTLMSNLRIMRRTLINQISKRCDTSKETITGVVHALLNRSIFIKYLEERKDSNGETVFPQDFYCNFMKSAKQYTDVLNSKEATYNLFRTLKEKFNGDTLQVSEIEAEIITQDDLNELRTFILGDSELESKQLTLWPLYSFDIIPIQLISSIYELFFHLSEEDDEKGTYYTPLHLVNLVMDEVYPWEGEYKDTSFFDPSCGSGVFLVEAYRRLVCRWMSQNDVHTINCDQLNLLLKNSIFGVDINEEAIRVASFSLSLAMCDFLDPRSIWDKLSFPRLLDNNLISSDFFDEDKSFNNRRYDVIIGNPPFIGYSLQSKEQKSDILSIYVDEKGKPYKTAGKIDYVAGWYYKAAKLMQNTPIRTAFVSTNSITQGEQVAGVWKPLYDQFGIHIDFAHRTFRWDSEASLKAQVHCVIVGFSCTPIPAARWLFDNGSVQAVENINAYLMAAPNVFVESRKKPICKTYEMTSGNRPADGGNLIIEEKDYDTFIKSEPKALPYIKRLSGATEFINNKKRWCLWLVGVSPATLSQMPLVMKRIKQCQQDRLSGADDRKKLADTPWLFRETNVPETAIVVPRHSTKDRKYIPFGFIGREMILTDAAMCIPNAGIYEFGILESNVHMAWMRAIGGRIKSDYRYSKDIVYNNFPWPTPNEHQKVRIEQTSQAILDARALYPDSSLADLYDELTMPPELRKAHQANDRAVMDAYGFTKGTAARTSESACVAELMKLYQQKASEPEK